MQVPDTFVVGCTGGNFSQRHNLMCVGPHRIWEPVCLPVVYQRRIKAYVRNAYTCITPNRFKENCYRLTNFHLHKSNTDTLPATVILFLITCHLFVG